MLSDERSLLKPQIVSAREFLAEYRFQLKTIHVTISIRFYRRLNTGDIEFEQSHYILTPLDNEPNMPGTVFYNNIALALEEAVNGFAVPHDQAIGRGYKPDESWLVPNDAF